MLEEERDTGETGGMANDSGGTEEIKACPLPQPAASRADPYHGSLSITLTLILLNNIISHTHF